MTRILTLLAAILIILAVILMFRGREKDYESSSTAIEQPNEIQTSTDLDLNSWYEFISDQGDFKISMPGLPQHVADMVIDQKTLEPHKYETYAAVAKNGVGYVVNVITLPPASKPKEDSLKSAVTDMLNRNKENKLKEMKTSLFLEKNAVDFSFGNKDVSIDGKVFAHDNKIFVLSMLSKKDSFNKKNFDFFVNSFHFLEEQPNKLEDEQPKSNEKEQNSESNV